MTEPRSSHADRLLAELPDQQGRTALVTGANGELGVALCRGLAVKGATVVMACRDAERGAAARDRLLQETPGADVHVRTVDLASLASVRAFARDLHEVPLLHAALHPDAQGGELWGPRWAHVRGAPRRLSPPSRARDIGLQEGLWRLSERLTGVSIPPEPESSDGSTTPA